MKQRRLMLLAALFATVTSREATSGGVPADMVYGQPGQLVSVDGFPETVINAIREVYDHARRPVTAHGHQKRCPTAFLRRPG